MAVISTKKPYRVPDLLGYLTLITEAHVQYAGDGWVCYDHIFQQIAATKSHVTWAQIDTTLWNLDFSCKARLVRCKFCFSITHTSAEYDWAPDQESNPSGTQSQQQTSTQSVFPYCVSPQQHRVCLLYNCESTPSCSFLTTNSNIFALFVPMIHMPLISTTRLCCTSLYPLIQ